MQNTLIPENKWDHRQLALSPFRREGKKTKPLNNNSPKKGKFEIANKINHNQNDEFVVSMETDKITLFYTYN